jgi:hypothetical protein
MDDEVERRVGKDRFYPGEDEFQNFGKRLQLLAREALLPDLSPMGRRGLYMPHTLGDSFFFIVL